MQNDPDEKAQRSESSLVVIDVHSAGSSGIPQDITQIPFDCSFALPEMLTGTQALSLPIRSDPAPVHFPTHRERVPFYPPTSGSDRLFVITYWVSAGDGQESVPLLLFVPASTILSHLADPQSNKGRRLRWEEWGPAGTRMRRAPRWLTAYACVH